MTYEPYKEPEQPTWRCNLCLALKGNADKRCTIGQLEVCAWCYRNYYMEANRLGLN